MQLIDCIGEYWERCNNNHFLQTCAGERDSGAESAARAPRHERIGVSATIETEREVCDPQRERRKGLVTLPAWQSLPHHQKWFYLQLAMVAVIRLDGETVIELRRIEREIGMLLAEKQTTETKP
jgi:hypothetical protein